MINLFSEKNKTLSEELINYLEESELLLFKPIIKSMNENRYITIILWAINEER